MNRIMKNFITAIVLSSTLALPAFSQTQQSYGTSKNEFHSRKLSGPRLGMSYAIPDGKAQQQRLRDENMGMFLSQFGWHFEWLVEPAVRGPAFVIEAIPFVGGVEYGKVIPSVSLVMGVRLPSGFEFGMGPQAYFSGDEKAPINSSLVLALGKSLDYNGVSIPLNVAVSTNPEGTRLSFVFGYAISKS